MIQKPHGLRADFQTPQGVVVSTYSSQQAAHHAVSVLSEAGFPVQSLAIVGRDVQTVEQITGRLTYGKVALGGLISGLYFGFAVAILLFLLNPEGRVNLAHSGAIVLMVSGLMMLLRLVMFGLTRRARNYTAVGQVVASRYDLLAPGDLLGRARKVLEEHFRADHSAESVLED
ncbi:MAG: hypothetical protein Q4C71_04390 [Microbacteriaceae bacterium]|nr:hypothetical protein [Microbacteriaceae bacterium]